MSYSLVLKKSDLVRETQRAWGFWDGSDFACSSVGIARSETVWFPKSQCTIQDHAPDLYRLIIPDWLAKKTGLNYTGYEGIDYIKD